MRISIDISSVVYETGVSWYTASLVRELVNLTSDDQFVLFGGSLRRRHELDNFVNLLEAKNVTARTFYLPPSLMSYMWNLLHWFPVELFVGAVDVYHASDWTQPPTKAYKVTTIHDLVPIRYPGLSHPEIVKNHRRRLRWVKQEVDKIITVSEFTKREIIELLGIDAGKIVVIPEAPQDIYKILSKAEIELVREKYKLPKKYLLAIGVNPRKNLPNILKAFAQIRSKERDIALVVVGKSWDEIAEEEGVIYLGHFPQEEMAALYSGAEALVYASLYEGFGLPILEAMACGCPVVTSNNSSMPEVAGDAGILVEAKSAESIAWGIVTLRQDREKYVKKGLEQVKKFSWKKTAEETLRVYKGEL